jgi:type I restriction enzyme S subunit
MAGDAYERLPLGDIADFRNGKAISPERYSPTGKFSVFGANGQIARSGDVLNPEPVIAIGRVGAYCGSVHYIPEPSWVTDNAIIAIPKKQNNLRYLFYLLRSLDLRQTAIGSAQPLMTQGGLRVVQAIVAPPKEQQAIACILGKLDDKIELNRKMSQTLEAMAQAIFKSWFVDFDPVRAKAEGQDPGLSKKIADLFPDSFQDSELGEIPKGWEIKAIGDLAEVVGGSTPSTKEPTYWNGGVHNWATPKDLSGLSIPVLLDTERCITDAGLSQISSGLLSVGTVLLSSRAPIGYLAIAEIPVAINQGFIAMKPKSHVSNLFLLLWANIAHEEIVSRANGSTFLEISKANFRPISVTAPSATVMKAFDQQIRPLYKSIVANERESRTLAILRDTLLPKLISGELRVLDSERIVRRYI